MTLPGSPSLLKRLANIAITLSVALCVFLAFFVAAPHLAAEAYQYLKEHHVVPAGPICTASVASANEDQGGEHFSPSENLELPELDHLKTAAEHAGGKNIAPYRDLRLYRSDSGGSAGPGREQGTVIRIYRDGEQFQNEERNAARFRDQSTTSMFRGQHNIHVRVKPPSPSGLMHLKAWSDGEVLREGSANWSPAALKRQDNNVRFSRNATEVKAFEADFEAMWNRASNTIVQ